MQVVLKQLDRVLSMVLIILMAAIVIDVSWQVLSRFIVGRPSSITEEIARFLLVWIGLLGSAWAFRTHAHLGLDILTSKLSFEKKLRADILSQLLSFIFAGWVMVYGGAQLVLLQLELGQTSAALEVKMGYVYSVLPLAGLLICIYAIDNIFTARTRMQESTGNKSID
jgi:TRAP-type C4-dicarboxylate transport system permease small subunit